VGKKNKVIKNLFCLFSIILSFFSRFVRLLRSGRLHHLAGGIRFVPDLDDISGFKITDQDEENDDSPALKELNSAVKSVDSALQQLFIGNDSENKDYFIILVKAFKDGCNTEQ
jgi:hypothetical protein